MATRKPATAQARLVERALTLIARQHGGAPEECVQADREAREWRGQGSEHERAWQTAERLWQDTALSAQEVGQMPAAMPRRIPVSALGFGLLTLLGVAGAEGVRRWQQPVYASMLASGHERLLDHPLPDGTRLSLDVHSDARVTYHRNRRGLRLEQGGAFVDVHRDERRPFVVDTPAGRVQVIGTAFEVRVDDGRLDVAVARGRVRVCTVAASAQDGECAPGAGVRLFQGQRITVADGASGPLETQSAGDVGAWREGWLVFDDTPLPQVIERWNDYLSPPLELASAPALHALRLTGSFRLDQPDVFLAALPQVLPVRVAHPPQGEAIWIEAP